MTEDKNATDTKAIKINQFSKPIAVKKAEALQRAIKDSLTAQKKPMTVGESKIKKGKANDE